MRKEEGKEGRVILPPVTRASNERTAGRLQEILDTRAPLIIIPNPLSPRERRPEERVEDEKGGKTNAYLKMIFEYIGKSTPRSGTAQENERGLPAQGLEQEREGEKGLLERIAEGVAERIVTTTLPLLDEYASLQPGSKLRALWNYVTAFSSNRPPLGKPRDRTGRRDDYRTRHHSTTQEE